MKRQMLAALAAMTILFAEADETFVDGVLTLDGVMKSVSKEADLGAGVVRVEMRNGGGVEFTGALSAEKVYSIAGDGLSATGVISVAAGKTVSFSGAELAVGAVGHTLVKRGAGTLYSGSVGAAASAPTRFIVEEGKFECAGGDFWGGHSTANTNCVIDVREGATYDHGASHGVVGPIELTGGTFLSRNGAPYNNEWADASLDGGVTAHACEMPSYMYFKSWGFLGHCNRTNCVFNVEAGARLIIDGTLTNGFTNVSKANRLIKRGDGELALLKRGGWTGGTVLEGGTIVIADPQAFSTGDITLAGDVTIKVLPGVEFTAPPIKGSGTITKTGAGIATFPTVEAGVTVTEAEAGTIGSAYVDGVVYLNGNAVTIDVPADRTETVTSIVETYSGFGGYTEIIKTGDGELVMPTGCENLYGRLIVRGGYVAVSAESCFGADGVTLENGGGIRFTGGFTQARAPITCIGDAVLDIPQDVTVGFKSNYFFSAGATVTKNGMGTWKLESTFRTDGSGLVNLTGTKWVVHEGMLKLYSGDNFGGASSFSPIVLEAHEDGVIELSSGSGHTPLCAVNLRGGRLCAPYAQFNSDKKLEGGGTWRGIGLNGPITVLPSEKPSRIEARSCHTAHNGRPITVFDVKDGATLDLCTMLHPGFTGAQSIQNGIIKRGGGTIRLHKPVGFKAPIVVEAGALELGSNVKINDSAQLVVKPGARVVLGDGSQLATPTGLLSKLCGSADVWFDAAAINAADGAAVSSVPNRGTSGGTFGIVTAQGGYTPTAPTYVRDGINGRGAIAFNGYQALVTKAYTNRGERASVFLVSKWTSWEGKGGKGRWGGPLSLSAKNPEYINSGDDNNCGGALAYQHGNETVMNNLATYSKDASHTGRSTPNVGIPYITHSGRDFATKKIFTEVFWADGYNSGTNTAAGMLNCDMDTVCVGGRLRLGVPQIWNPNGSSAGNSRMYIGQIGELLVFSRALTKEEETAVYNYLKKKWFDVGELSQGDEKEIACELPVEVPEGASAALAVGTTGSVAVGKTGAGALTLAGSPAAFVDVAEGTLAIKKGALPSIVDVWIDASDSAGMSFDSEGRVTNLVNRGSCGGAFVRNTSRAEAVPAGPEWTAGAINGLPALVFDGDSSLALYSYTNNVAPRSVSVYLIGERTSWSVENDFNGAGKWAGPFSLGDTTAAGSDENIPGVVVVQEDKINQTAVDLGGGVYFTNGTVPANGVPYMMVLHSTTNGYLHAYEKDSTDVANVPRSANNAVNAEPLRVNAVQLATRMTDYGKPQWYGHGNTKNRNWFGKIGEFIVTTEPLGEEQERELFAYLRKKWLNKGDGSTTPPAWLVGYSAAPGLDGGTVLAMADGTALVHEGDPTALGALEAEGTVNWTRVWDAAAGVEAATMFNVVGDVSLGTVNLALWPVPQNARLVGVGGVAHGGTAWTVTGDRGAATAKVAKRGDGFWIARGGTMLILR